MSGIAGIVDLSGRAVSNDCLNSMIDSMEYRGVDGTTIVNIGKAGFVQYATTNLEQSINEDSLYHISNKRYLITFQGRIDNREELFQLCDISEPLSKISDNFLVLSMFRKFDTDCAVKLIGDFAFVIWDREKERLFCCRDQMGVKPFFYYRMDSVFIFASEIKAIHSVKNVLKIVNNERIADFLACVTTERKSTFYQHILKLQPGHFILFQRNKVEEQQYWKLRPINITFKNDQEIDEAFFEIFKEAVKVRLSGTKPIGAFLSGGIDSSSIVCMAASSLQDYYTGRLCTFTAIYDKIKQCDERQYFQSVLDRYDISPTYLKGDLIAPEDVFTLLVEQEDEPFCSPHFFVGWNLMKVARDQGIKILLDGHDGDSALSRGDGLMAELAMHGRLVRLVMELKAMPNYSFYTVLKSIKYLYVSLLREKCFRNSSELASVKRLDFLSDRLLKETDVKRRVLDLQKVLPNKLQKEQLRHYNNISQPFHPLALEFMERSSARLGICSRFPMFDIRLISFCLSLPAEQKLKRGFNRYFVRRSLKNILPKSITDRKSKSNFALNLLDGFTVRSRDWFVDSYNSAPSEVYEYVDQRVVEEAMSICLSTTKTDSEKSQKIGTMLLFLSLSKWIEKNRAN